MLQTHQVLRITETNHHSRTFSIWRTESGRKKKTGTRALTITPRIMKARNRSGLFRKKLWPLKTRVQAIQAPKNPRKAFSQVFRNTWFKCPGSVQSQLYVKIRISTAQQIKVESRETSRANRTNLVRGLGDCKYCFTAREKDCVKKATSEGSGEAHTWLGK